MSFYRNRLAGVLVVHGGYRKIKKRVISLEKLSKWKFTIPIKGYSVYNISCSDPILKVIALKVIFLTMDTDDLSRPNLSLISSFFFFLWKNLTLMYTDTAKLITCRFSICCETCPRTSLKHWSMTQKLPIFLVSLLLHDLDVCEQDQGLKDW